MCRIFLGCLLIAFSFTVHSCKKDPVDVPAEFPVRLVGERVDERVATRLFTDRGEITDPMVVQAFEQRVELKNILEIPLSTDETEMKLEFETENTAFFSPSPMGSNIYDIDRKGTRFLFFSREMYDVSPTSAPTEDDLGVLYAMLRHRDRLGEPDNRGQHQTRNVRIAHGNYKILKAAALVYVFRSEKAALEGIEFNEFDTNVLKFVGEGDTLAVKEYEIIFTRAK